MEQLISNAGQPQTLAELFPPSISDVSVEETVTEIRDEHKVTLYDVLYACVTAEESNER